MAKLDLIKMRITADVMNRIQKDLVGACLKDIVEEKKLYQGYEKTAPKLIEAIKKSYPNYDIHKTDYKSNYPSAVEAAQSYMFDFILSMENNGKRLYSESIITIPAEPKKILTEGYNKIQNALLTLGNFQVDNKGERTNNPEVEVSTLDIFHAHLQLWQSGDIQKAAESHISKN